MSSLENFFFSSAAFNRLHDVYQNSTVYLTFPTNRTKRFEHSLGTMKLCGDMFYHGICNANDDDINTFFEDFKKQLEKIIDNDILSNEASRLYGLILDNYLDRSILLKVPDLQNHEYVNNVFYNKAIPGNIKEEYKAYFLILFQAIRLSALLHDIGHPPYSHITESAIKDVYDIVKEKEEEKRTEREKYFFKILKEYLDDKNKKQLHESMGCQITEKIIQSFYQQQKEKLGPQGLHFPILVFNCVIKILNDKNKFFYNLHGLIDSAIDGDRLDYISRDTLASGFKNGIIEYDRLLYSMTMIKREETLNNVNYIFAPDVKSINTVEDIFNRRWKLYRNIVFHHRVAKTDSLLNESIKRLMLDYLEKKDPEQDANPTNPILPDNISGLWKAVEFVPAPSKYFDNLSQWNDSWLITILRKEYFGTYPIEPNKTSDEIDNISYKLNELLTNNKHYYSLIKSKSDFDIIENNIKSYFDSQNINIFNILKDLNYNILKDPNFEEILLEIIEKKFSYIEKLEKFFAIITITQENKKFDFYAFLQNETRKYIENNGIFAEVLTIRKPMKTGFQKETFIVKKGNLYKISDVSTIKRKLEGETLSPYFFIYVRYKNDSICNTVFSKLLEELGTFLGEKLKEKIQEILNHQLIIS